jgi:hypothetical protein
MPCWLIFNLKAHRIRPDRGYADIALRTLDFIEANLKHEHGGRGLTHLRHLTGMISAPLGLLYTKYPGFLSPNSYSYIR